MPSPPICFCKLCNLEFASDVFDSCPVCFSPPVESARRPWSRTEFLFRNFGDKSNPIVRLHADQKIVNRNIVLLAAIMLGCGVVVCCLQDFRGVNFQTAFMVVSSLLGLLAVILGITVLYLKNLRPIEVLRDGSLRIPRAVFVSRSVTGMLINTAARAGQDASERSYYKLATSEWLPFVERMEKDRSLSLVIELMPPFLRSYFPSADSLIVEIRFALKSLAIQA